MIKIYTVLIIVEYASDKQCLINSVFTDSFNNTSLLLSYHSDLNTSLLSYHVGKDSLLGNE